MKIVENYKRGWIDNKSIMNSCCSCTDSDETEGTPKYSCIKCKGNAYLLKGHKDSKDEPIESCQVAEWGGNGKCALDVAGDEDGSMSKTLFNGCKMCHMPLSGQLRNKELGKTLASGLLNIFGVGGLAKRGLDLADEAGEEAGGSINDQAMVGRMQSQLSALKEGALKHLQQKSVDISDDEFKLLVSITNNVDAQINFLHDTIQYEVDMLSIAASAFSMCILSILLYIFKAM
tara:strand:- start:222 stop:917 length:696 start_codon:yes stop_codon:yes gene_type:complete